LRKVVFAVLVVCLLLCGCGAKEQETVYMETCSECSNECAYDSLIYIRGWDTSICANCFEKSDIQRCMACDTLYSPDGMDARGGYCHECADEYTWWCCGCQDCYHIESMAELAPGFFLCGPCTQEKLVELGYEDTVAWIVDNPNFGPKE